jgi:hypothetical protein
MKRSGFLSLSAAGLVLLAASASAQTSWYVQSARARVLSAPSFKAAPLGDASRGTKLTFLKKEGTWVKVSFYGKEGYISSILVSPYPPLARAGMIRAEDADLQQGARRRASTYTSAAAARGLAQDDRRRLSRDEKADYDGLERVEAFSVSEDDVTRFMEGGK